MPFYVLDLASETLTHSPVGNTNEYEYPFPSNRRGIGSITKRRFLLIFQNIHPRLWFFQDQMLGYQFSASSFDLYLINGEKSDCCMDK